MGLRYGPDSYGEAAVGEYWAMGESLTQQRRVKEEGFRVVNFFYQDEGCDGT